MSRRTRNKPRRSRFETLENRRVMAAYINEIFLDPLFGNDDIDQYVELRGTPNATLQSTYLVAVSSRNGSSAGDAHTVFDLSGLSFGDNGYLVLLQAANQYQVDPNATIVESVTQGFRGLPDNRFSTNNALSNHIDFIIGPNTFFLVESAIAPKPGDDIDLNDDGVIEKATGDLFSSWTVLDSVSMINFSTGSHAYGQIVFADGTNFTAVAGATIINGDSFGYVGRIGESVGHSKSDWVGGTVLDDSSDTPDLGYRLNYGIFGQTEPRSLGGRPLDHIGTVNFTGGVHGTAFFDSNKDGIRDPGEQPLAGVRLLADTNHNGLQDAFTTIIDAEDYADGFEMTNAVPGVTITTGGTDSEPIFNVEAARTFLFQNLGQRTFSHQGIPFFLSTRQLRMDFERPVRSVSVEFAGSGSLTYGRVEGFDTLGNSLGFVRTNPMADGQHDIATLGFVDDRIAYAVAYSDEQFNNSSGFGRIERLIFVQGEATAVTDINGEFTMNFLQPQNYELIAAADNIFQTAPATSPTPIPITDVENYEIEFGFGDNTAPVLVVEPLVIPEERRVGKVIGLIQAIDVNVNQTLQFTIDSISGSNVDPLNPPITINPTTGELISRIQPGLDFESGSQVIMQVSVTDGSSAPVSGTFTITLTDVNEPPQLTPATFPLVELAAPGTLVGTVTATDPDQGAAGVVRYDIFEGDPEGIFAINPITGAITLQRPDLLDFETQSSIRLIVSATDGAPFFGNYTVEEQTQLRPLASGQGGTSSTAVLGLSGNLPPASKIIPLQTVAFTDSLNAGAGGVPVSIQSVTQDNGIPTTVTVSFPSQTFNTFVNTPIEFANPTGTIASGAINASIGLRSFAVLSLSGMTGTAPAVGQLVAGTGLSGLVTVSQVLSPTTLLLTFSPQPVPGLADQPVTFFTPLALGTAVVTLSNLTGTLDVGQHLFGTQFRGNVDIESINAPGVVTVSMQRQIYPAVTVPTPLSILEVLDPQRAVAPVVIDLSNTNEPPEFLLIDEGLTVREDASSDSVIGVIRAFDPDAGQTIRVDVIGGTAATLVSVDPETGRVSLNTGAKLDFETAPELTLDVQVSDSAQPPLRITGTVKVNIVNVNESPSVTLSRTDAVLQEVSFGLGDRIVAKATLNDPENQSLKLEIIGGTGTDLVELTPQNEIKLKDGAVLDFETRPNWNVVLRVIEQSGGSPLEATAQLNVRVVNENENPVFANQSFDVFESARGGTALAQLSYRDPDAGQRAQLQIVSGDTDVLQLDTNGTIRLKSTAVLDSDTRGTLNLKIRASDPLGLSTDADVTIRVLPVNQPPRPTQILQPLVFPSSGQFSFTLPQDLFVDADGDAIAFSLSQVGAALPTWLTFDSTTRVIRGNPTPADARNYQLLVQATDNGSPALTGVVPLELQLTSVPSPLHNDALATDVTVDSKTQPDDVLFIINLLNALPSGQSVFNVPANGGGVQGKPDVNQDNLVSSFDAILVINALNALTGQSAEPELNLVALPRPSDVDRFFDNQEDDVESIRSITSEL